MVEIFCIKAHENPCHTHRAATRTHHMNEERQIDPSLNEPMATKNTAKKIFIPLVCSSCLLLLLILPTRAAANEFVTIFLLSTDFVYSYAVQCTLRRASIQLAH